MAFLREEERNILVVVALEAVWLGWGMFRHEG